MSCKHHWLIGSPNGPTVGGHCKFCGATREFSTSDEKFYWDSRAIHSMAVMAGPSDALGPDRLEEAYRE